MYAFLVLITLSAGVRLYKEYLNVCHVGEKDESSPAEKFVVTHTQVNLLHERAITKISQSETELLIIAAQEFLVFGIGLDGSGVLINLKGICS